MEYNFTQNGNAFTVNYDETGENHFIKCVNAEGDTFRKFLQGYSVSLLEKKIEGLYLDQELSQSGRVITSRTESFNATSQEQWEYFKSLTRNAERDIKMLLNGLFYVLYGAWLFDTEGNFIAESDDTQA